MTSDPDGLQKLSLEQSLLPKSDSHDSSSSTLSAGTNSGANEYGTFGTFERASGHSEEEEPKTRNERIAFSFTREDGNLAQRLLWRLFTPPAIPEDRALSGHFTASFISRVFVSWVFHVVWAATTRQLDMNDIDQIDPRRKAGTKTEEFMSHLGHFASAKSRFPLVRAIVSTFRRQFVLAFFCIIVYSAIDIFSIFSLRWLGIVLMRAYLHPEDKDTSPELVWKAVLLGLLLGSVCFARSLSKCHAMLTMRLVGGECRTLLASCMYAKAMRISRTAVRPSAKETGGQDKSGFDVDEDEFDVRLEDYEDCCSHEPAAPTESSSSSSSSSSRRWYQLFGAASQDKKKKRKRARAHEDRKLAKTSRAKTTSGARTPPTQRTKNASEVYWTEGPVLNSMSVDTERIEAALSKLYYIWIFILAMPGYFAMAWYLFSWPGIVACSLVVACLPILWIVANIVSKRRVAVNRLSEQRANMVMDMIQGVRFLKVFGWEQVFLERFHLVRAKEAKLLTAVQKSASFLFTFTMLLTRGTVVFSSSLYRYFVADLGQAYDVVPFLLTIRGFSDYLGKFRQFGVHIIVAWPSIRNVQDLLLAADDEPGQTFASDMRDPGNAVELEDAEFSWFGGDSSSSFSSPLAAHKLVDQSFWLQPLTLSIRRSELIAIVGPVACGKSSLVSGLVGEMSHVGGRVGLDVSSVAYCAQSAWIQNASVRENITFGCPMDRARYDRIVAACALDRDIDIETGFRDGDDTELGERGITISGGQKARIQLARTMYRGSDVVILDDPLSAVDAGTARHIFNEALLREMAGKCRILITHQLPVLSQCDRVVWMESGRIMAVGTYESLMAEYPAFADWVGKSAALQAINSEEESVERLVEEGEGVIGSSARPSSAQPAAAAAAPGHSIPSPSPSPSSVGGGGSGGGTNSTALMVAEDRAVHDVPVSLYGRYLMLATPLTLVAIHYFLLAASQAFNMLYNGFLSIWSAHLFGPGVPEWVYPACMVGSMLLHIITWGYFFVAIQDDFIRSSRAMVGGAIERLFHAPMSFFDTNPLGRIMNRFTQDVNAMDTRLPFAVWDVSLCSFAILSLIGAVYTCLPTVALVFVPWAGVVWLIIWVYKRSPLELERLEKLQQSHFVSKLAEGINGRPSLVSFGRVADFHKRLHDVIDELNSIHFSEFSAHAWTEIRSAFMVCILVFTTALLAINRRHTLHPSITLWVLIVCPQFIEYMAALFEMMADVQKGMTAVQRVEYYRTQLPGEGARHVPLGDGAGASWPVDGSIEVKNACMRYRPGLPLSLRDLNLSVKSGEKIGIVGRTGAGKSSLTAMLLRTVNIESGTVIVSGLDTASLGLHPLRRAMAIIPQDPTLFLGTIRRNLDPTASDSYPDPLVDARLEAALRTVKLIRGDGELELESTPAGTRHVTLDTKVETGGRNFSQGYRQLLALARALVRDTHIILIDEATSSVDPALDNHIQETIRRAFAGKTVLAIAHRIRTIISYDKVCVMDKGSVVEFDTPKDLWMKEESVFRKLCDASKINEGDFV